MRMDKRSGGGAMTRERTGEACAIDRRGIPRLRKPTPSQERRRNEKTSACSARNDRFLMDGMKVPKSDIFLYFMDVSRNSMAMEMGVRRRFTNGCRGSV